jgi:hypothetical protein
MLHTSAFILKIHTQMKMEKLSLPDFYPIFFHLQSYAFDPTRKKYPTFELPITGRRENFF